MSYTGDFDEIEKRFTYHPPKEGQLKKYQEIRRLAQDMACMFANYCPDSREKSLATTKLEEAVMWANAAIARRS